MTKMAIAIGSLRDERCVADHDVNVKQSDHAHPPALADTVADALMLATGAWMLAVYAMTESVVRCNAEAITAFACALVPTDTDDKLKETQDSPVEGSGVLSLEDLLASDRRKIACKTLGGAFESNLTKNLRKDMIVASSVVC